MVRYLIYILFMITAIIACEKVYVADLDEVEDLLVVEAIFITDHEENYVYLYKTLNFNSEENTYPAVTGAKISLIDDLGNTSLLPEEEEGTYCYTGLLNTERSYYLQVEIGSDTYQSEVQTVPENPDVDSIYAGFAEKTTTLGAVDSEEDVVTTYGLQIYTDINNSGDANHYRFDGKKIIEYYDYYDTVMYGEPVTMPIYGWRTYSPSGIFNIAGPPEYSTEKSIKRHELEFFNQNYYAFIADTQVFAGWIYIIDQYGISEDAYSYYSDLNNQLEAKGKIFDPVYVQVEGNVSCTSDPDQIVLGNFEIESHREYRYFLKYYKNSETFSIQEITAFYDIPSSGYVKDIQPDFWEN